MEEAMTRMFREDGDVDLGHGHTFSPVHDQNEQLVGWLHTHPDVRNPAARPCQSFCSVRPGFGPDTHDVVAADPLTLSPSLKCRVCGAHGYVQGGKWEPTDMSLTKGR